MAWASSLRQGGLGVVPSSCGLSLGAAQHPGLAQNMHSAHGLPGSQLCPWGHPLAPEDAPWGQAVGFG